MPGHGGNNTYDLWNVNPMPCQQIYAFSSAGARGTSELGLYFDVNVMLSVNHVNKFLEVPHGLWHIYAHCLWSLPPLFLTHSETKFVTRMNLIVLRIIIDSPIFVFDQGVSISTQLHRMVQARADGKTKHRTWRKIGNVKGK